MPHPLPTTHLPRLLVILDQREHGLAARDIAEEALSAGARLLLWRAPHLSPATYTEEARAIAELVARHTALLLIHARADVAITTAANGCHLPERGMSTREARHVLGQDRLVGRSLHHVEQLKDRELVSKLDYATLSPIFLTPSKPGYGPALSPTIFREARELAPHLQLYALGGITPERVGSCLKAGAHGVAVMGGISHASDPHEATHAYLDAIQEQSS